MTISIGQRWVAESEIELGLGIIAEINDRTVTVFFPAADVERQYATHSLPLSRIRYEPGQTAEAIEYAFIVQSVTDNGRLIYEGIRTDTEEAVTVDEIQLSPVIALHTAMDRLVTKQLDKPFWFALRYEALQAQQQRYQAQHIGFIGTRIDWIPHQLYIAQTVCQRPVMRVMLADEVGLGKTIEAGLILNHALLTDKVKRVLIIVPGALTHQWFVEMVRRFYLHFHIFDEERVQVLSADHEHPFEAEQLVLTTHALAQADTSLLLNVHWDMVIIDEAHRLPDTVLSDLAQPVKHLILLSATPEQLGAEHHFKQLKLLDPTRYSDFADYQQEQTQFARLSLLINRIEQQPLDEAPALVTEVLGHQSLDYDSKPALLRQLADRYGTGRAVFRNTRRQVSGFPKRRLASHPLSGHGLEAELTQTPYPETLRDFKVTSDPRTKWLADQLLDSTLQQKFLVICAEAETAINLAQHLRYTLNLSVGVFHEAMDLIERDRAAAVFADFEEGTQALICSEIGSEGRNFQFAHQLVLYDLPLNPDLLEQRIGRLDRIGQSQDILIHVPYLVNTAQHVLHDWYHQGMQAFEQTNAVGYAVKQQTQRLLEAAFDQPADTERRQALVIETQAIHAHLSKQNEDGKNRLLELTSFDPDQAQYLITQLKMEDQQLPDLFLDHVFDAFGVDTETQSATTMIARPGDHMLIPEFPYIPEDGVSLTTDRITALSREDVVFVTWEHPLLSSAIDLVTNGQYGQASVALFKTDLIPAGTWFVECLYKTICPAAAELQIEQYFKTTLKRYLLNNKGQDLSAAISNEALNKQCTRAGRHLDRQIVAAQQSELVDLLEQHQTTAQQSLEQEVAEAVQTMTQRLTDEHERQKALQAKYHLPISDNYQQIDQLTQLLQQSYRQLDAVRVIVCT